MSKKRKKEQKKQLANIGKEKYDFVMQKEKYIYSFLSCYSMDSKEIKSMDNSLKFDSYKSWKNYILEKYKSYDNDKLEEFYRYLNLLIRNKEFSTSSWNILIPIFLTVFVNIFFEVFMALVTNLDINIDMTWGIIEIGLLVFVSTIVRTILILVIIIICLFMIKQFITPLSQNDIDYYLLTDYKEIIETMIKERKEVNKKRY